ncbi:MAG: bifunctional riboflavin kinase/FAD synthetase [Myxococcota bacterium]|nr:bifunctional riboflavin kinase/FAD synthetase [Myxococcota bacterium]
MTRARSSAVVPGNHDGVHAGHRALIAEARRRAERASLEVVALTFDPHPLTVLTPERAPVPLTTIERRKELLRDAGADDVVVARFDAAYASRPPDEFVEHVLLRDLSAKVIVVGPDFRFGAARTGTIERLRELGAQHELEIGEVAPVELEGIGRVSSTRIREALREGDVERAAVMLGRVHELAGTVIEGNRRGRTIGFPTANLDADPILMPADGVYAVVARVIAPEPLAARHGGALLRGVANLGTRPTFAAGRSVEVHLFDFEGDLYGARLRVGFAHRLRGERKFDGIDALREQIARDAASARAQLAGEDPTWRMI